MKNNHMIRTFSVMLAVTLCLTALSTSAFAGSDESCEETPATSAESSQPLSPDGNLSLIDDIGSSTQSGKQFITVETKNGNVFYLIIDRDDEGAETVHFLNQVDEADLLMLMGDDAPAADTPAVCNCKEKCVAGAASTNCPVCKNNFSECSGKETATEPEPEPEQPEKKSSGGLLVIVLLLVLAGGGAFAYVKFIKPKQGVKVSADPDDYDFEDEEMVNEDEQEDTE